MGITPSSRYHPDNMAKRAAQEAAAPGKPAPLTTSDLAELARAEKKRASAARLDAETEARRVAPPQPFDAAGKKGAMGRCNQGRADAVPQGIHRAGP